MVFELPLVKIQKPQNTLTSKASKIKMIILVIFMKEVFRAGTSEQGMVFFSRKMRFTHFSRNFKNFLTKIFKIFKT